MTVDGVEIHIEGEGAETIVMVHGWPDTYRLWDAQVAFLKSRYRCVRFTLPGFDIDKPRRADSIDEIAEFLRRVVEHVSHDVAVMHRGAIVETGPTEAVMSRPQHDYTRTLLAAIPRPR